MAKPKGEAALLPNRAEGDPERSELQEALHGAVDQLAGSNRKVFILHHNHGC